MLRGMFRRTCLAAVLAVAAALWPLYPVAAAANQPPVLHSIESGALSDQGLMWLLLRHSDADGDRLSISRAEIAYKASGNESIAPFTSILDTALAAVTFASGNTSIITTRLPWKVPEALLELDQADITFRVRLKDKTAESGNAETKLERLDIKTLREVGWKRIPGLFPLATTFNPGDYATLSYTGGGLVGYLGQALNMGKVEVTMNGAALPGSPIDNYPDDIPPDAFPQVPTDTRFPPRRLLTASANAPRKVMLKLLSGANPRAVGTGLSISTFSYELHLSSGASILSQIREVLPDDPRLKLFTAPPPLDPKVFATQLKLDNRAALARAKAESAGLPPGTGGYLVNHGEYGGPMTQRILGPGAEFDASAWRADFPYLVEARALSPLGVEGSAAVTALLFRLSVPQVVPYGGQPFPLGDGLYALEVSAGKADPESPASAEAVLLTNGKRFPEFPTEARILVVQPPDNLEGFPLRIAGKAGPALGEIAAWDPQTGSWTRAKSQSNAFTVNSASLVVVLPPPPSNGGGTTVEVSSSGGGCLLQGAGHNNQGTIRDAGPDP